MPAVIPSNTSMLQLAPIAIGEFGSPEQTGHAHVRRGVMSQTAISAVAVRMHFWAIVRHDARISSSYAQAVNGSTDRSVGHGATVMPATARQKFGASSM